MGIKVLSLFDGISTGRLALEMAGLPVDTYFASEVDPAPMAISARNWPDVIQLGDVRDLRGKDLLPVDLVIGGSPCQGFSRAGRHLNFDDPRSALFFEFARIVAEIRSKNPAVMFLLENVAMKTEWEGVITETMGVPPISINSRLVAPQNRPRTYWTNIPGVEPPADRGVALLDVIERDVDTSGFVAQDGLLFDPSIPEQARKLVTVVDGQVRVRQATKAGYIVAENGDGVNLSFPTSTTRRGRVVKGKANTLDRACEASVYHDGIIRRFSVVELERLQTLPDGYTAAVGVSETDRKNAIGNGWTAAVIADIFAHMRKGGTYG